MKDIMEMSREEFFELPYRTGRGLFGLFDSIVILPCDEVDRSGYAMFDFVACKEKKPICRLSGCSDVLHLEGIMGNNEVKNPAWTIDCLPKSGLLRVFPRYGIKIKVGACGSPFDIWSVDVEL